MNYAPYKDSGIISNPTLDKSILTKLSKKIVDNSAVPDDYKLIDSFLSNMGLGNYLTKKLEDFGYDGFEEFIDDRKRNRSTDSMRRYKFMGVLLGALETLELSVSA